MPTATFHNVACSFTRSFTHAAPRLKPKRMILFLVWRQISPSFCKKKGTQSGKRNLAFPGMWQ